ncbi:MAG TPA: acyl carrier protein [Acidimicrobiales bacterium]|jgi:acyl carrier protein|nr:acyl carrier protein [Acidimicrobiales bacterium]
MERSEIRAVLAEAATEVLGVEPDAVVEEANFKDDLDADSLDLVELVMALEERLDITIGEDELGAIKTVGEAVDVVVAKLAVRST